MASTGFNLPMSDGNLCRGVFDSLTSHSLALANLQAIEINTVTISAVEPPTRRGSAVWTQRPHTASATLFSRLDFGQCPASPYGSSPLQHLLRPGNSTVKRITVNQLLKHSLNSLQILRPAAAPYTVIMTTFLLFSALSGS